MESYVSPEEEEEWKRKLSKSISTLGEEWACIDDYIRQGRSVHFLKTKVFNLALHEIYPTFPNVVFTTACHEDDLVCEMYVQGRTDLSFAFWSLLGVFQEGRETPLIAVGVVIFRNSSRTEYEGHISTSFDGGKILEADVVKMEEVLSTPGLILRIAMVFKPIS